MRGNSEKANLSKGRGAKPRVLIIAWIAGLPKSNLAKDEDGWAAEEDSSSVAHFIVAK
jgi:hypothetical protein